MDNEKTLAKEIMESLDQLIQAILSSDDIRKRFPCTEIHITQTTPSTESDDFSTSYQILGHCWNAEDN